MNEKIISLAKELIGLVIDSEYDVKLSSDVESLHIFNNSGKLRIYAGGNPEAIIDEGGGQAD